MTYYIKLFFQIIAKELARYFTYRANIFNGPIATVLILAMQWALWMALYKTGNATAATFGETMTYFIITGSLFDMYGMTGVSDEIGQDIRSGDIALRLSKPQPYQFTLLTLVTSNRIKRFLTVGLTTLALGFLVIGIQAPASAAALMAFILCAILGNALFMLIDLILSYSAFYLTDYWYISWVSGGLMQLFGGTLLPIWFYPELLAKLSKALPFAYVVNVPMDVYLGRTAPLPAIGMQLLWLAILILIERITWRHTITKLTVQGG